MHAAVAAIQFALEAEDGQSFLRLWNEGEFDVCRREWPEAPKEVYVGADPMLPETRAMLGAISYQQGRMRFFIEQVMRGEQPDTRRAAAQILDELYPNNGAKAAPSQPVEHPDTARLNLLTSNTGSHDNWSIRHRIKPGKPQQWQMIDDGAPWGRWHNCPRKAIDAALAAVKGIPRIVKDYEDARAEVEGKKKAS